MRLYVVCPLAYIFFVCIPLSVSLATGLMVYQINYTTGFDFEI